MAPSAKGGCPPVRIPSRVSSCSVPYTAGATVSCGMKVGALLLFPGPAGIFGSSSSSSSSSSQGCRMICCMGSRKMSNMGSSGISNMGCSGIFDMGCSGTSRNSRTRAFKGCSGFSRNTSTSTSSSGSSSRSRGCTVIGCAVRYVPLLPSMLSTLPVRAHGGPTLYMCVCVYMCMCVMCVIYMCGPTLYMCVCVYMCTCVMCTCVMCVIYMCGPTLYMCVRVICDVYVCTCVRVYMCAHVFDLAHAGHSIGPTLAPPGVCSCVLFQPFDSLNVGFNQTETMQHDVCTLCPFQHFNLFNMHDHRPSNLQSFQV